MRYRGAVGVLRFDGRSRKRVRRIRLRGNWSWSVWVFLLTMLFTSVAAAWWALHLPAHREPVTEVRPARL